MSLIIKRQERSDKVIDFIKRVYFYFEGRYGIDEFTKFLLAAGLAFGILNFFSSGQFFSLVGIGLIAYGSLRPMSKEKRNRQKELEIYYKAKRNVVNGYRKIERVMNTVTDKVKSLFGRKNYTSFTEVKETNAKTIIACPNCGQKLRVPKNKKINIRCNKCHQTFMKQT